MEINERIFSKQQEMKKKIKEKQEKQKRESKKSNDYTGEKKAPTFKLISRSNIIVLSDIVFKVVDSKDRRTNIPVNNNYIEEDNLESERYQVGVSSQKKESGQVSKTIREEKKIVLKELIGRSRSANRRSLVLGEGEVSRLVYGNGAPHSHRSRGNSSNPAINMHVRDMMNNHAENSVNHAYTTTNSNHQSNFKSLGKFLQNSPLSTTQNNKTINNFGANFNLKGGHLGLDSFRNCKKSIAESETAKLTWNSRTQVGRTVAQSLGLNQRQNSRSEVRVVSRISSALIKNQAIGDPRVTTASLQRPHVGIVLTRYLSSIVFLLQ